MRKGRRQITLLLFLVISTVFSNTFASAASTSNPALLRQHLQDSIGNLPWEPTDGYLLTGQFILKGTGEEIPYEAKYARSSTRWAADFSHAEDRSRHIQYVFSGTGAWASSPEITADIDPGYLPYIARFDFPYFYAELLRILERGNRDPLFGMETIGNEVHIKGSLQNGWEATFIFNTIDYFPRKVAINTRNEAASAWLLTALETDGSCTLIRVPQATAEFEVWFSEPVDAGGYRYARRMDFTEHASVLGTFFLEKGEPIPETIFNRPPAFPWLETVAFHAQDSRQRPSLYLSQADLPAFRLRLESAPWLDWRRTNGLAAFWALCTIWIGPLITQPPSFRVISLAIGFLFLGLTILFRRYRQRFGRRFPLKLLLAGLLVSFSILLAGVASIQFHSSKNRSLLALHLAIRQAVTGNSFYARRAAKLLRNLTQEAPAPSIEDLGYSCQAYALAYDLIRSSLLQENCTEIEKELFEYGRPLFGALHGWRSNMTESYHFSTGLGMLGLAIGCEPFVARAGECLHKNLNTQLVDGIHLSGPGPGNSALETAVNFFYALKQAGRVNYYDHPAFRQYVRATLQMLSPVGTLPLFGNTNLDQSARLSAFFLKVANHLPEEIGQQCAAAYDLYWASGRYHDEGLIKWILAIFQPMAFFFENPYLLFQYDQAKMPTALPSESVILGNGQAAILRTGSNLDSAYLALNTPRSTLNIVHRDAMAFDLYAYQALLLHGPGFPGRDHPDYRETTETSAANSITLYEESQARTQCSGIVSALLNQPLFDYVRVLADNTYDYGQVQRDVMMVRPDKDNPAYFILIDEVFVSDPQTTVQWYLHGRGKLSTSIDQISRWKCTAFTPPGWSSQYVSLEAYSLDRPGELRSKKGVLYSKNSFRNLDSETLIIDWTGSKRFCTVLFPHRSGQAGPKIEIPEGGESIHVGATDWACLGSPGLLRTVGPLTHASEYTIVRSQKNSFPSLLMIFGFEFRFGPHSIISTKPISISMDGLRGGLENVYADTRIEIHSPEIRAGDRFFLDGELIQATESGTLVLMLGKSGEHMFHRASDL